MMRIEIVYMNPNKDATEFECDFVKLEGERLILTNVTYPFEAAQVVKYLNDVDFYVEYEDEED